MPPWWNAATVQIPDKTSAVQNAAQLWQWLADSNPMNGKPLEDWYIIGPFDAGGPAGFDTVLPPEEGIRKETYKGKGGEIIGWKTWKAGTPCPITNTVQDAVIYAGKTLACPAEVAGFFVASGDDRLKIWLDGALILTNSGPTGATTKLRSLVWSRFAKDPAPVLPHAERIASLYEDLGDTLNFRFWMRVNLANQKDVARLGVLLTGWVTAAGDSDEMSSSLYSELESLLVHTKDPQLKTFLANALVDLAFARNDPRAPVKALRLAGVRPNAAQAAKMITLYETALHYELDFWLETFLSEEKDNGRAMAQITAFEAKATDLTLPVLYKAIERTFLSSVDNDRRKLLATRYMEFALSQFDTKRAWQFLKTGTAFLMDVMPWEEASWELKTAMLDLDQDAAKAALERLAALKPGYEKTRDYTDYKYLVLKMRSSTTGPTMLDLSVESTQNAAQRLYRNGDTDKLNQLIRDTLLEKGGYMVSVDNDNDLFVGSKARYRAIFEPHRAEYQKYLQDYLTHLDQKSEAGKAEAAFTRAAASLIPAPASGAPPRGALSLKAAAGGRFASFHPVFDLPPGVPECVAADNRLQMGAELVPVLGSAVGDGELVLAQNSRTIVCLRSNLLAWSYALPLHAFWPADQFGAYGRPPVPLYIGGRFAPAVVGDIVAARLAIPNAGLTLNAFDKRTGAVVWRWSEPGKSAVSCAAAWRGARFLFLASSSEDGIDQKVELVGVEAATGQVVLRVPISTGARLMDLTAMKRGVKLETYWNMPPPVIAGNVAYVDTAGGIVAAIDLTDASLKWMRVYSRKGDQEWLAERIPAAPVVGDRTVLFAPVDSKWVFLVDRESGQLLARKTDLPWTSFGPCGPGAVAVLTPNAAYFLSLDKLADIKTVPGRKMQYVQALADGCVVREGAALAGYDPAGRQSFTADLPGDVSVSLCRDRQCYGFTGPDGSIFGILDGIPASAKESAASAGVLAPQSFMPEPRPLRIATGGLYASGHVLCRTDAAGRRVWEAPVPREASVQAEGDVVSVVRSGRIWLCDAKNGAVRRAWPEASDTNRTKVVRVGKVGNHFAVLASVEKSGLVLFDMSPITSDAPQPFGRVPDTILSADDFVVMAVETQACVAFTYLERMGAILTLSGKREGKLPGPEFAKTVEAHGSQMMLWRDPDSREAAMFRLDDRHLWRIHPDATIEESSILGLLDVKEHRLDSMGALARLTGRQKTVFLYPPNGKMFELPVDDAKYCCVNGTTVCGLRHGEGAQVIPFRYDLRSDAAPADGKPIDPQWGARAERTGQLAWTDRSALFVRLDVYNWSTRATLWGAAGPDPVISHFLPLPPGTPVRTFSPAMAIVNETILTREAFERCLNVESTVRTNTTFEREGLITVDGFLDEWSADEFCATPKGRYAVRRGQRSEDVWIAVEIIDPRLVERLGAAGLDDKLEMPIMSGTSANFAWDSAQVKDSYTTVSMFKPREGFDFAYSISPDAKSCRIEAHTAASFSPRRKKGTRPPDAEKPFGDVAFRLLWRADPSQPKENLLENESSGPLSFLRVRFEY